jgi:hypothetical protein
MPSSPTTKSKAYVSLCDSLGQLYGSCQPTEGRTLMSRRETVIRVDCDGTKRQHEVELRTWKATAEDGRSVVLETESWHIARDKARIALQTQAVTLEEVEEETVLFTDGEGNPLPTQEELARSEEIMKEHPPVAVPLATTALERMKRRAGGDQA